MAGMQDLIQRLCHPDRSQRLGCTAAGPAAVRSHPFLKPIDWTGLTAGAALQTPATHQHSAAQRSESEARDVCLQCFASSCLLDTRPCMSRWSSMCLVTQEN